MPNQSRSEGTYLAGQVTVINTDDVTPEVRALLADRDRWERIAKRLHKRVQSRTGWSRMWHSNALVVESACERTEADRDRWKARAAAFHTAARRARSGFRIHQRQAVKYHDRAIELQTRLDGAEKWELAARVELAAVTVCETDGRPCHTTHHGGCMCHERRHADELGMERMKSEMRLSLINEAQKIIDAKTTALAEAHHKLSLTDVYLAKLRESWEAANQQVREGLATSDTGGKT